MYKRGWDGNYRINEVGHMEVRVEMEWYEEEVDGLGMKLLSEIEAQAADLLDPVLSLGASMDYESDLDAKIVLRGWRFATPQELEEIARKEEDAKIVNTRHLRQMAEQLEAAGWHVDVPMEYRRREDRRNAAS